MFGIGFYRFWMQKRMDNSHNKIHRKTIFANVVTAITHFAPATVCTNAYHDFFYSNEVCVLIGESLVAIEKLFI